MILFLKTLSLYEAKLCVSESHTYLLLGFIFQMMVCLIHCLIPDNSVDLTVYALLITLLMLNFQGHFWIQKSFNSAHFRHLSLQPDAFTWSILIKLWVVSFIFMVFFTLQFLPWSVTGCVKIATISRFILALPYFISLQGLIMALSQGHLQKTYLGPLLMLPLQIPILLFIFLEPSLPWAFWFFTPWLLTFAFSWILRKIIQMQAVL